MNPSIKDCLELRLLVDILYDIQDVRIRTESRLRLMPKESKIYSSPLRDNEDKLTLQIEGNLAKFPVYTEWLCNVKGIGPRISGSIIAQTMIRFVSLLKEEYEQMVSQSKLEAHEEDASHKDSDTQKKSASQNLGETHEMPASQFSFDTHSADASQKGVDTQIIAASHENIETHIQNASPVAHDAHEMLAFSTEQLELAQKTENGNYLIPIIRSIGAFDTVSKYWAWWGLDVRDGHAPKRVTGKNIDWNPKMRALSWKISKQFVMQGEYYRGVYEREKLILTTNRIGENGELYCQHLDECQAKLKKREKPACKGHIDAMAKRKAVKLFLSHLWQRWRELEGLPVRQPYVIEKLGHTTKIEPEYTPQPEREVVTGKMKKERKLRKKPESS